MLLVPRTALRIPASLPPIGPALPQPTVQPQDVRLFLEGQATETPIPLGVSTLAATQSQGSSTKENHPSTSCTGVAARRRTVSNKRLVF